MKKIVGLCILATIIAAGCVVYVPPENRVPPSPPPPENTPADQWSYDNQDMSDFYGYLGPYGLWVSYTPYGYVWIPRDIGYRWRPYSVGHWLWSDYGWTWISGERWGWLVYHYGRWGWDGRLGWFWVPDTVWGPAWVAWRWGDQYIGWAPLPPGGDFVPGYGFRRWDVPIPGHYWNFVAGQRFLGSSLDRWILPPERNVSIISFTRLNVNIHVRENRIINDGVNVDYVHRVTNQVVERRELKDARGPGEARVEGRDVVLFRPSLRRNESARPKEVLDRDQAASRVQTEQPRPAPRTTPEQQETALRQKHENELKLLEQSQANDLRDIERQANTRKAAARTVVEKQRIDKETKTRIADLKKKHEAEKAQLSERQKKEEDQVRKGRLRRRDDKH
jgi:hypothetical protein